MADLTRVAEVLAAHIGRLSRTCSCGAAPETGVLQTDAHMCHKVMGFAAWHRVHVAEVLAAAGLLPTETEWGVRWANGQIVGPVTEAEAHAWKSGVPVRREVTEWRPADEERTSQPAQEATQAPAGRDGGAGTPANTSRVISEAQGGAQ